MKTTQRRAPAERPALRSWWFTGVLLLLIGSVGTAAFAREWLLTLFIPCLTRAAYRAGQSARR